MPKKQRMSVQMSVNFFQGNPPKSSSTNLEVSISDVNDNKPLFESSFYDVQIAEDVNPGHCFLTVKKTLYVLLFYCPFS
jgi:hypothetical protein